VADAVVRLLALYQRAKSENETALAFFRRVDAETVKAAVADLANFDEATASPEDYVDIGDQAPFKVAIGQGECAA
jgi:hypothetical protein